MTIALVTGGARSGKSRHAEAIVSKIAETLSASPIYIATAQVLDSEMGQRIAAHRQRRPAFWRTIEEPILIRSALGCSDEDGPRLIDCLTLWLSNMMLADIDWKAEGAKLCTTLREQKSPVVLVTNEVGLGIVPDNELARRFCDAAGVLNQMVAEVADSVTLVVAGYPMQVK